ncbi:PH domain-containing protein [Agromyces ramosus]|uniref:Membrane protein YdbT with pleckstrin-like domain n=1 Tax=Agromyces ramosus TaxID=33879 RepID=A0ABU0RBE2_9MICO|nr:PH domain-containing protein [Agromyces ramosus]MDQ0895386.1 putative membrane protein YdbT with pleckstrin-like domain [Agromyces ramosus]
MRPAATPDTAAPLAMPAERVVARLRRHARILIIPAALLIVVAGAMTYALAVVPEFWQQLVVVGVAGVLVLFGSFLPFLSWLTRRTTITSRRVIVRSGVFVRVRQELLHSRAYDVTVRRSWAQSAFGSGDVRIDTGHDRPVVLRDLPKPQLVEAALRQLVDEAHSGPERRRVDHPTVDGDTVVWGRR